MRLFAKNTSSLNGEIACPGDKSISQRAVIIGALTNQKLSISGFLEGEDPISTINALNQIGSQITIKDKIVTLLNRDIPFTNSSHPIDLGNSGTGMRLMMGLISGLGLTATLIGDKSLMKRPMERVSIPLNAMGGDVFTANGLPPVNIKPRKIYDDYSYAMPVASAQLKSSILLAGVASNKKVSIYEPSVTRDHTEIMLKYFGLNVESEEKDSGKQITFNPGNVMVAKDYHVVGDFSSASFLIIAALIAENANILIKNVGLNPTRSGLIGILHSMGGDIQIQNESIQCGEMVGDILVKSSTLNAVDISGSIIANIIDEIPVLCIAAACANGTTTITDAQELRVKESDRLEAIGKGLSSLGVQNELFADGISIKGGIPSHTKPIEIDSYGDHRIAMSFLISSLKIKQGVIVDDCKNIYTSYPNFIETMSSLGMQINAE
ncbi:3-phosphoshikimate 1-carboxyvinyltransferase [Gammaproteobacteria bacterium]|nr:3-phosphoshikimate 1-carboxyvinyltransferase [Gammaproteobacteria bacterium]